MQPVVLTVVSYEFLHFSVRPTLDFDWPMFELKLNWPDLVESIDWYSVARVLAHDSALAVLV